MLFWFRQFLEWWRVDQDVFLPGNVSECVVHMCPVVRVQDGVDVRVQRFIDVVVWQLADHDSAVVRVEHWVKHCNGMSSVGSNGLFGSGAGFPDLCVCEDREVLDVQKLEQIFLCWGELFVHYVVIRLAEEVLVIVNELRGVLVHREPFVVGQMFVMELCARSVAGVLCQEIHLTTCTSFGGPCCTNLDAMLFEQLLDLLHVAQEMKDVLGLDVEDVQFDERCVIVMMCHCV